MNKVIIKTENLCKYYNKGQHNEVRAIDKVNIDINRGEFISIIGPSGSGKSTLLHMIGLLDRPTCGKIYFDGKDISNLSDNQITKIRREKVGFVFQQFNLIPLLTALENVELPMTINGHKEIDTKKKAEELLKKVGLGHRLNNRPPQLSGGEKQRVAIARALANDPEIILADEPTGNLDTKTGKEIINLLRRMDKKGFTLAIITHDQRIAKVAEKVINIKDGRIIKEGG
ncbi:MAG: ATP-binding cassette domain-containing protein [Candidatus Aenigmarchaeota archaeon]|nr:ATP-binding cassette domain-containing protein [Candidatus Aenigmarchaeota archaeon]